MSFATFTTGARRELDHRVNDGLEITLYWNVDDDSTSVEIYRPAFDETITFRVARDRALDAFNHPYAYLAA